MDISNIPKKEYSVLARLIAGEFALKARGQLTNSMDEVFQEYSDGTHVISIEWDIWTGFSVRALNSDSDSLVKKIHNFLKEKHVTRIK